MRTLLIVALVLALLFIVAGLLAAALVAPAWVGVAYGCVAAVATCAGLEAIAETWARRPAGIRARERAEV